MIENTNLPHIYLQMDSHFNIFVYYPLSILSNFDNFVYSRWCDIISERILKIILGCRKFYFFQNFIFLKQRLARVTKKSLLWDVTLGPQATLARIRRNQLNEQAALICSFQETDNLLEKCAFFRLNMPSIQPIAV